MTTNRAFRIRPPWRAAEWFETAVPEIDHVLTRRFGLGVELADFGEERFRLGAQRLLLQQGPVLELLRGAAVAAPITWAVVAATALFKTNDRRVIAELYSQPRGVTKNPLPPKARLTFCR